MELANVTFSGTGFTITFPPTGGGEIVTANLIQLLDAGNVSSYPGTGTTWFDMSGGNYDGTLNGPSYSSNNQGYLNFMSGDYVSLPTSLPITSLTEMTWNAVAWYDNVATAGNPGRGSLFSSGAGFTTDLLFSCYQGLLFYQINNGGDGSSSIALPNVDTWYNLCIVFDGAGSNNEQRLKLYINGVEQTLSYSYTVPTTTPNSTGSTVEIGRYTLSTGDVDLQFKGRVAFHSLYNRALNQSEITQNWNAIKSRYGY